VQTPIGARRILQQGVYRWWIKNFLKRGPSQEVWGRKSTEAEAEEKCEISVQF